VPQDRIPWQAYVIAVMHIWFLISWVNTDFSNMCGKVSPVSNDLFLKRKHISVQTAFGIRITMAYD
jgi:hypothetical protein